MLDKISDTCRVKGKAMKTKKTFLLCLRFITHCRGIAELYLQHGHAKGFGRHSLQESWVCIVLANVALVAVWHLGGRSSCYNLALHTTIGCAELYLAELLSHRPDTA